MSVEAAAQAQLQEVQRDLEAIRYRLKGVHATLPPGPAEIVQILDVEVEKVTATHIRAVIETLLADKIEPAIRDLREVSTLPEKG